MTSQFIAEILPNLYLGSWHATQLNILEECKIKNVFHFGFEVDEQSSDINYYYSNLEDNSQSVGILKKLLPEVHNKINESLKKGAVLVCCSAGKSRSVSVMISYLILVKKYSFQDAYDLVKSKRQIINPNPQFLKMLQTLET